MKMIEMLTLDHTQLSAVVLTVFVLELSSLANQIHQIYMCCGFYVRWHSAQFWFVCYTL